MFYHEKGYVAWNMIHAKVRKCGKDSLVPVIMAMDSLAAGSDTTGIIHNIYFVWIYWTIRYIFLGNTCAFLLYHLAANPDKQSQLYDVKWKYDL